MALQKARKKPGACKKRVYQRIGPDALNFQSWTMPIEGKNLRDARQCIRYVGFTYSLNGWHASCRLIWCAWMVCAWLVARKLKVSIKPTGNA